MADVRMLARRVGISNPRVESKTAEYVRLATSRLSGGSLGQGELCKTAVCMELASITLNVPLDASLLRKCSGVSEQVYKSTRTTLQKLLGVGSKATARDLCVQFGCARLEGDIKKALAQYKERFVRRLAPEKQGNVDFGRPVFLAAAFYLVARKNKSQVDKSKLLQQLGVAAKEFAEVQVSMVELISELVGGSGGEKRKASEVKGNRELLDATGGREDEDEECSSSEEEVEEEGMVGRRVNKKRQQKREFEDWKEKVLKPAAKKPRLTEKSLRQATLSFGAGAAAAEQQQGGKPATGEKGGKGAAAAAKGPLQEKN